MNEFNHYWRCLFSSEALHCTEERIARECTYQINDGGHALIWEASISTITGFLTHHNTVQLHPHGERLALSLCRHAREGFRHRLGIAGNLS